MIRLGCAILLLLLVSGCGYRLAGDTLRLPDGASVLSIEMFDNRTTEPYLENILTKQVTRRLLLFPDVALTERPEHAEAILGGRIVDYTVEPSAYDAQNRVTQYRAIMKIEAELRRSSDGRILWRGNTIRYQIFSAAVDLNRQDDLERLAQEELAARLAEDLSCQMTETF